MRKLYKVKESKKGERFVKGSSYKFVKKKNKLIGG